MVKSADRVITVLEALIGSTGLTFTEIGAKTQIPKSSLHNLLETLQYHRALIYNPQSQSYTLGPKIWEMAMAYFSQLQVGPLAQPFIEQLRDALDETIQLAVLDGVDVVYVARVDSSHPVQLVSRVGRRLPAHATGIGKALLADLSEKSLTRLYSTVTLPTYTPRTLSTRSALVEELQHVRHQGYAIDRGEYSSEVRCVAVPICGVGNRIMAAVSISMPAERFCATSVVDLVGGLRGCADAIGTRLGATDPQAWRTEDSRREEI